MQANLNSSPKLPPTTLVKSPITDARVAQYVVEKITTDNELERRLRVRTRQLPNGGMISSSDVGALLSILAHSVQTRFALEIGTFTGYTALKIAGALPAAGKLICCDVSDEWTSIGRPYWKEAGVEEKIDLRLAPGLETLSALIKDGKSGAFDFAFIDADKAGYEGYYDACLKLVRSGGLIALDNMLWHGEVANDAAQDDTTKIIRALNAKISADSRVEASLLTVGDGVMLARKK